MGSLLSWRAMLRSHHRPPDIVIRCHFGRNVFAVRFSEHDLQQVNGLDKGKDMDPLVERLETMLESGNDNLLLRFSLGKAYTEMQQYDQAIAHLEQAILFDPEHSSSWFWLGRAQYEHNKLDQAKETLDKAVAVATEKGDQQTVKMAQVFLRRVQKAKPSQSD